MIPFSEVAPMETADRALLSHASGIHQFCPDKKYLISNYWMEKQFCTEMYGTQRLNATISLSFCLFKAPS